MNKKWISISLTLAALLFLSACNLARSMTGGETPSAPAADLQTQVALAVQQTQAAAVPDLPQSTFTPSLSPTPDVPMVTVSVETNCRTGPGTIYAILGVLLPGQTAEVIGRSAASDNWIIRLPSNPSVTCWLWGYYASVVGDTAGLTVYTPPPTPTPSVSFTLSYLSTIMCGGNFASRFQLVNTGTVTFRSYRVSIVDSTTALTTEFTTDGFTDYTGCMPSFLLDLEAGESGVAGNWGMAFFPYDPAGHSVTATFTLCSEVGFTGVCAERSIGFTP